jgi:cysteine desulfurase
MSGLIYLDHAATTPVDPAVARAMGECLASAALGNASSITHAFGRRAHAQIEHARAQVAALIGAEPRDVIFTSGATESNNLAILGTARANADRGRHIITSRTEHKAVLDPCRRLEKEGFSVTWLTPDRSGVLDVEAVRAALRADTTLVSIMHVNNETGVIQDIAAIGALCREGGIAFHSDAAQSADRLPLDTSTLSVDFLSFTAHKLYGPAGIGALYVRRASRPLLQAVSFGGGQERGLRPGTLPTHQIIGFGLACELAAGMRTKEQQRLAELSDCLWNGLRTLGGVHLNGEAAPRVPGIVNVSFEGVEGESLVTGLTSLALSTGSACNSSSGDASYVLRALGRDAPLAQSSLRFSLGRGTTAAEIDRAVESVKQEVLRLRAVSPLSEVADPAAAASRSGAVESDPLSPITRDYFERLPGAGRLPEGTQGEAGSPAQEAWVRFHLAIDGGTVKAARFQAWGCPHTLAVAAWLTQQLPGRRTSQALPGTPAGWARTLAVPTEKLGRLLIVEDALRKSFSP